MQTGLTELLLAGTVRKNTGPGKFGLLDNINSPRNQEARFEPKLSPDPSRRELREDRIAEERPAAQAAPRPQAEEKLPAENPSPSSSLESFNREMPQKLREFVEKLAEQFPADGEALSAEQLDALAEMLGSLPQQFTGEELTLAMEWMQQQGFITDPLVDELAIADAALLAGLLDVPVDELGGALREYAGNARGLYQDLIAKADELGLSRSMVSQPFAALVDKLNQPQPAMLDVQLTNREAAQFFMMLQEISSLQGASLPLSKAGVLATLGDYFARIDSNNPGAAVITHNLPGFAGGKTLPAWLQQQWQSTSSPAALTQTSAALQTMDMLTQNFAQPGAADMARNFAIGGAMGGDGAEDGLTASSQDAQSLTAAGQARENANLRGLANPSIRGGLSPQEAVFVRDQIVIQFAQGLQQGQRQVRIQLDPPEMGRVTIAMELGQDGKVQLMVSADNRDTLNLLQRDSRELAQALQQFGLEADANSMEFTLNEPSQQDYETAGRESDSHTADAGMNDANQDGEALSDEEEAAATLQTMDPRIIQQLMQLDESELSEEELALLTDLALVRESQAYSKLLMNEEYVDIEI